MAQPTIKIPAKHSQIMWQEVDEGVPEPVLLFESYRDIVSITQGEHYININYESIPAIIKLLKRLKPPE